MIRYFWEGVHPLVKVKIEQRGQKLNRFEKLVDKTVDTEAKAALRPRSYTWKTNQHCFQGSWPSTTKASTQGQLMKNPKVEEPKSRPQESKASGFQHSNSAETSKKARKEKKKNNRQNKRNCHTQKGSISATRDNNTNANNSKKKKNGFNYRGPSKVIY